MVKICSILLVIREVQIKSMITNHYTPIRKNKILKMQILQSAGKDVERLVFSYVGGGRQNDTTTQENVCCFLCG